MQKVAKKALTREDVSETTFTRGKITWGGSSKTWFMRRYFSKTTIWDPILDSQILIWVPIWSQILGFEKISSRKPCFNRPPSRQFPPTKCRLRDVLWGIPLFGHFLHVFGGAIYGGEEFTVPHFLALGAKC